MCCSLAATFNWGRSLMVIRSQKLPVIIEAQTTSQQSVHAEQTGVWHCWPACDIPQLFDTRLFLLTVAAQYLLHRQPDGAASEACQAECAHQRMQVPLRSRAAPMVRGLLYGTATMGLP